MEINQIKKEDVCILEIAGRLDTNTSNLFENKIVPLINEGETKMIVDFSKLEYISSAGLRVLLMAAKMQKKISGKIVLCCMKDFIKEIFEISGFVKVFTITDTLDAAIEVFK